jgi:hypothetical protein
MVVEKEGDITTESQNITDDGSGVQIGNQTSSAAAFGEAVDVYGDVATAEELGYVQRGYVNPVISCLPFNRHC